MKTIKQAPYLFICAMITITAQASSLPWTANLSLGSLWEQPSQSQFMYLQPDIFKGYVSTSGSYALLNGELFLGLSNKISSLFVAEMGLALTSKGQSTVNGVMLDDGDPNFVNFNYKYHIQSGRIAAKTRLIFERAVWGMNPYTSAALGMSLNNAKSFELTALNEMQQAPPLFTNELVSALSYSLGVGVVYPLSEQWQAGIGYEFTDWGKSHLGRSYQQTLNTGIGLSHLFSNAVQLSLSYTA